MPAVIRDLDPPLDGAAAALFAAAFPDRAGEPAGRAAEGHVSRWAAVEGSSGRVLAYGAVWRLRPGKFRMDLVVCPDRRREGVGGRLLAHLTDRARAMGATLQARADSEAEA